MCPEVNKRIDDRTVISRSSADCYFSPDLDLNIREVEANKWQVMNTEVAKPGREMNPIKSWSGS